MARDMKTTDSSIVVTEGGYPALWERGGAYTRRGGSVLVTEPDGSKPRPLAIRGRGHTACGNHALVGLRPGMYVIYASRDGNVSVERIKRIGIKKGEAVVEAEEVTSSTSDGGWTQPLAAHLVEPIMKALDKARTYHCRYAVWVDRAAPQRRGATLGQLAQEYDAIKAARSAISAQEWAEMADWEREIYQEAGVLPSA